MIRSLYRSSRGTFTSDVPVNHWRATLHDEAGLFWADFGEEPPEVVEPLLREVFNFHPLAIEGALRDAHVPKIDNWGEYAYAIVHCVTFNPETLALQTREVDVFLGANYLVTHHRQAAEPVNRLWNSCQKDQRRLGNGPDHLLYNLLDLITTDYMPVFDALDDAIDLIEDQVFQDANRATVNTIFQVKRAVLHLRRIIGPQREVLNRLARDDYAMIDARDRVYFRDVYDHLVRLADLNESLRDLVGGALDTYLSVSANRTNEIMKVLTIISALFMPISFLAGFFGMNFLGLPFGDIRLLLGALGVMVITPAGMFLYFRYRGWV